MELLIILLPLLPFAGFLINGLAGNKVPRSASGWIASVAVLISFVISVMLFMNILGDPQLVYKADYFQWIVAGDFRLDFSLTVDRLSAVMMLIITGVGFLIHMYSIGYMHDEEDYSRYFAYLNLFVFFMVLLVLGSSYALMFVGWEGVGLCSYLLIGFWYRNNSFNEASKKAFIMNRVGDLGFLLGMFLIFMTFGSLDFDEVHQSARSFSYGTPVLTTITLLLFIGATGKSAQIPLFTWLPDAMAGPTPVSALIHAATMVTAGIYMIVRANILFTLSVFTPEVVAVIGLFTALLAALIGLKQNDIKKVLAYSTVSQLGFMFVALGVGAYTAALFHVITHAFFKALLFLGAGSVIHAMGGEQDIRKMGGLKKALPVTHLTFLVATIAISGIPPFAGFFSKDEILASTFASSEWMFVILAITSAITAIYMFRLYFLTFSGEFRGTGHQKEHLHESPSTMTIPLIILGVLSFAGGFIGMPEIFHAPHLLKEYMKPVTAFSDSYAARPVSHAFEYAMVFGTLIILAVLIGWLYKKYVKEGALPEAEEQQQGIVRVIASRFYVDEIYDTVIVRPLNAISRLSYQFIEKGIMDGIVDGSGQLVSGISGVLRNFQNGKVGTYLFGFVIATLIIFILMFVL